MTDLELTTDHSNIYRLLSACFYEPDRELFLEDNLCGNLAELLEKVCPEAMPSAEKMAAALVNSSQVELSVEHAALFIGPFELISPPYGSIYLEKNNRLMGDTTMEVMNIYAEAGLKLDVQEPADHISFELEFIHYLFSKEKEKSDKGDKGEALNLSIMRNDFLRVYLASWVPRFCQKIRTGTKDMFYMNLADCLETFIHHESIPLSHAGTDGVKKHAYQSAV